MKRHGYNRANKLVEVWKERYKKKYAVGVQGTSHWYFYQESP